MPVLSPNSAFIDALRFGATLVQVRFQLYKNGAPTGKYYTTSASTGSFTVSRNSAQRRTGQFTIEVTPDIPPPPLMPVAPNSPLNPFGTELYIEYGIASSQVPGATYATPTQWVPLGLFTITETAVDDTIIDCVVTTNLADRSYTISQRAFLAPYSVPATPSGLFADEIQALLNFVWSQQEGVAPLAYNIVPTNATVPPATFNQGSDPWQAVLSLANAVGYELYFDAHGVVVGKPVPDPFTQPVTWNYTDDTTAVYGYPGVGSESLFGSPYSIPVEVQVTMTRQSIYNDIVIQGTGTANAPQYNPNGVAQGQPLLAQAADTNPSSPTYIKGGLGNVPNFVSSNLVTAAGAQQMANTMLQVALSSAWTVTLQVPPNPIFDIDDVITVTRPRVGLYNARVVVDTITHGISYADTTLMTGRVISNNPPATPPGAPPA